jgi:nitrate/nitrite-specific signal transduction histidine kinase
MSKKNPFPLRRKSIRARLLVYFILVAILPTLAISAGSILFGYYSARQNAVKRLDSLIALEEMKINTWLASGQNELVMTLNETYLLERIQVSLKMENKAAYYDFYKEGALYRLNRYLADTRLLNLISVLDLNGNVVLSTDPNQEGKNYAAQSFLSAGLQGAVTQVVQNPDLSKGFVIVTVYPVMDGDGQVAGELMGTLKPESLAALLEIPDLPLGSGRVMLVDTQNNLFTASTVSLLLSQDGNPAFVNVHSQGIDRGLASKDSGFLSYQDELGHSVYGVRRWIAGLNMALIVEQDQSAILADIFTNQIINLLIIAAGIGLAVFISLLTARRIATPLAGLAQASVEIASGNFDRAVQTDQEDEIGVLAKAFNSMASQLRALVENLEGRVKDRTAELQESNQQLTKRALQMETTSQVSRQITSILDMDALLSRIVNLIQESFAYYHIGIYLLERDTGRLLWCAGSHSISSHNMVLALNSQSLNGRAAMGNQAVLVDDVRQETSFLADPNLPETLSELVIPLRMGEQLIGTMDIHHRSLNGFSTEDLKVLQGLGDQIAIAINNAQLYEKIQALAVVEERNRMARELHDSISQLLYSQALYADAGSKYLRTGQPAQAAEYMDQLQESAHQALKEMRLMIYELRPSILESEGLWGAIQHRLETVERRSGVEVLFEGEPSLKIPAGLEKELYLIAQEALNNVLKHSRASTVKVSLSTQNGNIVFSIIDNGTGFDPAIVRSGLGLENIRQHAEHAGGVVTIDSRPGEGASLVIRIPGSEDGS